jgi:4-oxalomesaconate tautomerase
VGPFAVERGLVTVDPDDTVAEVRIRMLNGGGAATACFPVRNGRPVYAGDCAIAGVPGTAAPVEVWFTDTAGSATGSLLPTGSAVDVFDEARATCIDNGMPVVVVAAADLGATGYESCDELEANIEVRSRVESLRLQAGRRMGLGDVTDLTVPKVTLVAPPVAGGHLSTRTFIPHRCHDAIGVLGAVSVAAAALLPGTPAAAAMAPTGTTATIGTTVRIAVEHPTGTLDATIVLGPNGVERSGIVRTARKLMDGVAFLRG